MRSLKETPGLSRGVSVDLDTPAPQRAKALSRHHLLLSPGTRWDLTLADVWQGLTMWRLWGSMGWNDVLQRYRRSLLGPFWLTLSMSIMIGMLGVLYAHLFGMEIADFMPYLCLGLLIWSFISTLLNEAGTVFIGSEAYIRQMRLPFTLHVCRFVWRNLIIFAHNAVVYVAIALIFKIALNWSVLLVIPGLLLLLVNGLSIGVLLGMLSARFRDIPQIVTSLTQVLFFVTPIVWKPEMLKERIAFALANPVHHFIELLRAPLLGDIPSALSYGVALAFTLLSVTASVLLLHRFRSRIAYWI